MRKLACLAFASAISIPLLAPEAVEAGADYCHTDRNGNYVCIQSVFGPRNNRGMVFTVNGNVYSARYNCYNYGYESTSIKAVACWSYNAIKAKPTDAPDITNIPESVKGIMDSEGFIPQDKAINLDKIRNAFPPEMK